MFLPALTRLSRITRYVRIVILPCRSSLCSWRGCYSRGYGGTATWSREGNEEMTCSQSSRRAPLPKQCSTHQRICTRPLILLSAQIVIVLAKKRQPAASPCPKATVLAAKYLNTTFYLQLGTLNTHGIYKFFVQKRTARTDQTTWIDGSYNISTGRYQSSSGLLGRSRI